MKKNGTSAWLPENANNESTGKVLLAHECNQMGNLGWPVVAAGCLHKACPNNHIWLLVLQRWEGPDLKGSPFRLTFPFGEVWDCCCDRLNCLLEQVDRECSSWSSHSPSGWPLLGSDRGGGSIRTLHLCTILSCCFWGCHQNYPVGPARFLLMSLWLAVSTVSY